METHFCYADVVPIVAFSAAIYGRRLRAVSREVQDALAQTTAVAEEGLGSVRTVRSFANESFESNRYKEAVDHSFSLAKKRAFLGASFAGMLSFAGYASICGVLWYGGNMVVDGTIAFGQLTSFMLYTFTVAFAVSALSGKFTAIGKGCWCPRESSLMARENTSKMVRMCPKNRRYSSF